MSRDQVLGALGLTQPEWCQDFLGREQLLPGGIKLDVAALGTTYPAVTVTVSFAAPSQAFAGTGNGVMSGLSTSSTAVREVFTVRLKTAAANGGTFSVVGSVSGAQADAVVGTAYDNGKVAFTIADGSTDFVVGDTFTVTVAGVPAGATAIPVSALSGALPAGTVLNFGNPGQIAVLPNGAAQGATSLVTLPLDQGITNAASYTVQAQTFKSLPSGIAVGRTYTERDANAPFGPAADADDEIFLLAFPVHNLDRINDGVPVRAYAGVVIKENYLPGWSSYSTAIKSALRARYIMTLGDQ